MRVTDADGKAAIGTDGYFYIGAARELPGVRELFDVKNGPFACIGLDTHCLCFYPCVVLLHTAVAAPKATRYELYKKIDADYYGYRDEDDGLIVPLEREAEEKGIVISVLDSPLC